MKKGILLGFITLIVVLLIIIILYFKPEIKVKNTEAQNLESKVNEDRRFNKNIADFKKPNSKKLRENNLGQTPPTEHINPEKLFQDINSSETSINYVKIDESGLPPFEIESLKQDYENLNRYGSYSGGVITNEFTKSADFKKALEKNGGIDNILNKLNFVPVDIENILGNNFKLIGADYSGALNKGKFNSIFRYYESDDKRKLEINEMYLNPENNYSIDIYQESINFYLSGIPATLQSLKGNKNQEIYSLDFTIKNRVFSISGEGFGYSDFLKINSEIVNHTIKNNSEY